MKKRLPKHTISKGSVFDDLGLPPEHKIKADIARAIELQISKLDLNQTEAAKRMGIKQPDLSNILRGKFRGFSVGKMANLLTHLDCDVSLVIRPHGSSKEKDKQVIPFGELLPA